MTIEEALMSYEDVARAADQLGYRDKLRLAQRLLQLAVKEEEERNPERRDTSDPNGMTEAQRMEWVAERLRKLRPSGRDGVLNSIAAMFQFHGGISESDKEKILAALIKEHYLTINEQGRVLFPD